MSRATPTISSAAAPTSEAFKSIDVTTEAMSRTEPSVSGTLRAAQGDTRN